MKKYLFIFLIILFGGLLSNFKLMTNTATPGGDGARIFPYIHFVDNSESFYPLWNPYKDGGVPTLADPQRFVWLAKLVDSKSSYANLQFNLILLAIIVFVGFSVALLAIELNMSIIAALLSSFVFTFSWIFERWVICGRINRLIAWAIICLALVCCIRWLKRGKIQYFFLLSLLCGKLMFDLGYYGLFMFGPLICLIFFYYGRKKIGKNRTIVFVPLQIFTMCMLGVLSYGIFLFPLVDYMAQNLAMYNPLFTLVDGLPDPDGIIGIFFPLYTVGLKKSFWFVSTVSFPLLFFFFFDKFNREKVSTIILIILLFNIAILLGKIYPFKYFVDVLVGNVFLSQIRQTYAFYFPIALCISLISGFGYDSISRVTNGASISLRKRYTIYLISFIVISLTLTFLTDDNIIKKIAEYCKGQSIFSNRLFKLYMTLAFIAFITFPLMNIKGEKIIKGYILVLFLLQIFLFRVEFDHPKFTKNISGFDSSIVESIKKDKSYFSYWDRHPYLVFGILDLPHNISFAGFSLYFSPEHRWLIKNLLGREILSLRPHWVDFGKVKDWNENALKISNMKYYIARSFEKHRVDNDERWFNVREEGKKSDLYQIKNWIPMLRVFDKWVIEKNKKNISEAITDPNFNPSSLVYLNEHPGIRRDEIIGDIGFHIHTLKQTENQILLQVTSNKNGILYIPAYYDKYWQAYVDRKKTKILRGNFAYRAIAILKGTHKVKLKYENPKFKWGSIISVVTLLIFTAISVIGFFSDKRKL
ncbi:YfhO family protein [bacterium]|nr:YfhO family protein [bacterium]